MEKELEIIDRGTKGGGHWNRDKKAEIETEIETKWRFKDQEPKGGDPRFTGRGSFGGLRPAAWIDDYWGCGTDWQRPRWCHGAEMEGLPSPWLPIELKPIPWICGGLAFHLGIPVSPFILQLAPDLGDLKSRRKYLSFLLSRVFFLSGLISGKHSRKDEILKTRHPMWPPVEGVECKYLSLTLKPHHDLYQRG